MKLSHDREYLEHLLRGFRGLSPISSIVGRLRNMLSGAVAIVNGAASKTALSKADVNTATKVLSQIVAGLSGIFIDREVYRSREGQRDATQAEATLAVRSQV